MLVVVSAVNGAENGGTESPFNFGFGARELSLGGSNITHASPSAAVFWNSSRLARAEHFEITGYHSKLYQSDVAYQYMGLVYPTLDYGSFGIGIARLGISGINKRDENNFDMGSFDDSRLGIYLAYGKSTSNYDIGIMFNIESHSIDNYSNTSSPGVNISLSKSFAIDNSFINQFSTSIQYSNLLKPTMKLTEESVTYPGQLQLGLSTNLLSVDNSKNDLKLYTRFSKTDNISLAFSSGVEYTYNNILNLRTGIREGKPSYGAGLYYGLLSFDYAFVNRDLGAIHMFSVTSSFGMSVADKREMRIQKEEEKFNRLMSKRLEDKNNSMIADLSESAKKHMDANEFTDALSDYQRLLFLTKSNNQDTTDIVVLIDEISMKIEQNNLEDRYANFLDSAYTRYANTNYIEAKYYSNLALEIKSESKSANQILDSCNYYIAKQLTEKELLESQILVVDSLLNYGNINKAFRILSELYTIAPDDQRIQRLNVRTKFEKFRNQAESAYSADNLSQAKQFLLSAEKIYPGHQWCHDFADMLEEQSIKSVIPAKLPAVPNVPVVLSENIKQEAAELYRKGQDRFESGDLVAAVSYWEQVENLASDYKSVRQYLVNAYKFLGIEFYGKNKLQDAVAVWKKAEHLQPDNDEIKTYINRTLNEINKMKELTYDSANE